VLGELGGKVALDARGDEPRLAVDRSVNSPESVAEITTSLSSGLSVAWKSLYGIGAIVWAAPRGCHAAAAPDDGEIR